MCNFLCQGSYVVCDHGAQCVHIVFCVFHANVHMLTYFRHGVHVVDDGPSYVLCYCAGFGQYCSYRAYRFFDRIPRRCGGHGCETMVLEPPLRYHAKLICTETTLMNVPEKKSYVDRMCAPN